MPKTKEGGWVIDDRAVVLKRNPYTEPLGKKKKEETK